MIMLHTCAGLTDRPTTKVNRVSKVHLYVSTVEVLNRVHPIAAEDLGTTGNNHIAHLTIWEGTSCPIPKFQEMPLVVQLPWVLIHMDIHLSPSIQGPILKFWVILDQTTDLHSLPERLIIIMITGSHRQPHARFDKRYNQRYSPPVFPLTSSLNSSFPEALSRSLLQIAENQSRTIDAMKASQEAQAAA